MLAIELEIRIAFTLLNLRFKIEDSSYVEDNYTFLFTLMKLAYNYNAISFLLNVPKRSNESMMSREMSNGLTMVRKNGMELTHHKVKQVLLHSLM